MTTDWREKLAEDMANAFERPGYEVSTIEAMKLALAVAEPVIRKQADLALREETDEWEKSHNTLVEEIERLRTLVIQLEDYNKALSTELREENARLREALQPFVEWCANMEAEYPDLDDANCISWNIKMRDIRRAASLVSGYDWTPDE